MIFAPTDSGETPDTPSGHHEAGGGDEAPLSAPAVCGARRRGARCGLAVLHDGDHAEDHAGSERSWPRGRRAQRRRDALVAAVERLRDEVAQPLEV